MLGMSVTHAIITLVAVPAAIFILAFLSRRL
jgi:hypothetical protein